MKKNIFVKYIVAKLGSQLHKILIKRVFKDITLAQIALVNKIEN